jgi:hypothetical protein
MTNEERRDDPNTPPTPIPEPPPGLRAGLGFHPAGSRTHPSVGRFTTSNTRLVVLGLVVVIVVIALLVASRG